MGQQIRGVRTALAAYRHADTHRHTDRQTHIHTDTQAYRHLGKFYFNLF